MKQPNWKAPLILSTTVLVLGSFAYWLAYSHKPKKEQADTQNKKPLIYPSETAQIIQFRLKSITGVIEGKCLSLAAKTCKAGDSGDWQITYPAQYKGDSDSIKSVISQFTNMMAVETIDLSDETPEKRKQLLEEYGLSDAKRTTLNAEFFELTFENGKKTAAWFGDTHPIGNKIFVGSSQDNVLNDKTIFLMSPAAKADFDKPLTYFRDKSIYHFDRTTIDSFTAKTSSGKLDGKVDNGLWYINQKLGDHDRIETVFSSIAHLRAKDFAGADTLKGAKSVLNYHLHAPKESFDLELFFKNDQEKMGKDVMTTPHYYVKASGQTEIFEVDSDIKKQIDKSSGELRESALLKTTEKLTATHLKLSGGAYAEPVEFHSDGKAWSQKSAGMKLDPGQISSFLDLLINSHAKEIVALPTDKKLDSFTFTLGDDAHPEKAKYLFFSTAKQVYAQDLNQKANEAYLLDQNLKSALPFKPDTWKMK